MSLLCVFMILFASSAKAFDHLSCDSTLGDWSVHGSMKSSEILLNSTIESTKLTRNQSLMLLLRNAEGKEIAAVAPWNGIQLFKGKTAVKQGYAFEFKSDKETWFQLTVHDRKHKTAHYVSCKMSF